MKPRRQITLLLTTAILVTVALGTATLGQRLFVGLVQAGGCFDYAQRKAVPDLAELDFVDVTIATNRFRGHICQFVDRRTGAPVSLAFDEADVPYVTDTLQVGCMVMPFLGVVIIGVVAAQILRRR